MHIATTIQGMEVAVKIQHPGVADSIDSDISILGVLLSPLAPLFLPTDLADSELWVAMKAETDYLQEVAHAESMWQLLLDDASFCVPRVAPELCAERVIATELLPG